MEVKPGYVQTEVGVIPKEWEVKRLGDVAEMGSGGTPPSSVPAYYDGDIPWASISDMTKGGKVILSTDRNLTRAGFTNSAAQMFPAGTILYAMYASLGECSIAGISLCSSQAILGIRPKNKLSGEYLYYFLTSLKSVVKTLGQQGTQANLNKGMVQDFRLSLPPLDEQTAIATALSDVDGLLGGLDRLIAKKRDLKQAAMQQLLTGQTRLPGFHGEWEVKRLGDVAEMRSGGTPSSSVPVYYDGDIPWASISDMTKGGKVIMSTDRNLTRTGFMNSAAQMFPAGTILYAMYASLGECSIAGISLCTSQAILGIHPKNKLVGEYLYYFLTSLKGIVKTLGQQGTQANLNKGMVQDFRLSLPPLPEQTAIASVLTEMDGELAVLEQRREKTRALKQAMMQELLTGRTRLV